MAHLNLFTEFVQAVHNKYVAFINEKLRLFMSNLLYQLLYDKYPFLKIDSEIDAQLS